MANPYYNATSGVPIAQTRGTSAPNRAEYLLIAAGFTSLTTDLAAKGAITGQAWTGAHDYTGATMTVAAPTVGSNPVTKTYADSLTFAAALPAQGGNANKFITTNGATASWSLVPLATSVSGILPVANGGTGVANNAASTITISGAFASTFTLTGTTSVTFPVAGTLATLAGTEAFTNKTYNGNTWTAGTGTLTIAAGKTLTVNNTMTLAGTDAQTYTFPATSATIARTDAANSFVGIQNFQSSPILPTPTLGDATQKGATMAALANALAAAVGSSGAASFKNRIIGGSCRVAQRGSTAAVLTTRTYGGCDRIAVSLTGFGSVTAGNIVQSAQTGETHSGFYQQVSGLSTTGTGSVQFDTRLELNDVFNLNSKSVTVSALVKQDTGSALTATPYLYKANSADNFGASTLVATGGGVSVPTGTATVIPLTFTLGATDASNGLEVRIIFSGVGAVTTKNFYLGDFSLVEGSVNPPFEMPWIQTELAACQRYTRPVTFSVRNYASGVGQFFDGSIYYPPMRATPTNTLISSGTQINISAVALNPSIDSARPEITAAAAGDTGVLLRSELLVAEL